MLVDVNGSARWDELWTEFRHIAVLSRPNSMRHQLIVNNPFQPVLPESLTRPSTAERLDLSELATDWLIQQEPPSPPLIVTNPPPSENPW